MGCLSHAQQRVQTNCLYLQRTFFVARVHTYTSTTHEGARLQGTCYCVKSRGYRRTDCELQHTCLACMYVERPTFLWEKKGLEGSILNACAKQIKGWPRNSRGQSPRQEPCRREASAGGGNPPGPRLPRCRSPPPAGREKYRAKDRKHRK